MTGNTINCAISLASCKIMDVGFYSTVIFAYFCGFAALRHIVAVQKASTGRFATRTVAPAVMLLFALTDVVLLRTDGSRWAMALVATATGLINAACTETTATGPLTMMTGHMQTMARVLSDAQRGVADAAAFKVARGSCLVLSCFTAGVMSGTFASGGAVRRLMPLRLTVPAFTALGAAYGAMLMLHGRST